MPHSAKRCEERRLRAQDLLDGSNASWTGAVPKGVPWRREDYKLTAERELTALREAGTLALAFDVARHQTMVEGRPVVVPALFVWCVCVCDDHDDDDVVTALIVCVVSDAFVSMCCASSSLPPSTHNAGCLGSGVDARCESMLSLIGW